MISLDLLSNLGMIALFIGTIPSIKTLIKERHNLKAFDIFGSIWIIIGQAIYTAYFMLLGNYITVLFSIPLVIFWVVALIYTIKTRVNANSS
jgi:hypothetical protein